MEIHKIINNEIEKFLLDMVIITGYKRTPIIFFTEAVTRHSLYINKRIGSAPFEKKEEKHSARAFLGREASGENLADHISLQPRLRRIPHPFIPELDRLTKRPNRLDRPID